MKKFFTGGVMLFLLMLLLPMLAKAETKLKVNLYGWQSVFEKSQLYAGYPQTVKVVLENTGDTKADVFVKFRTEDDAALAKNIGVYFISTEDEKFKLGGDEDELTLRQANEKDFLFVDRLRPQQAKEYKIVLGMVDGDSFFSKNESLRAEIDFSVKKSYLPVDSVLANEERRINENMPESYEALIDKAEERPAVSGAFAQCENFLPKTAWVVMLIIFTIFILIKNYRNYLHDRYEWKKDLMLILLGMFFWYFFDNCRQFGWFFYGVIIAGVGAQFAFLLALRKTAENTIVDKTTFNK